VERLQPEARLVLVRCPVLLLALIGALVGGAPLAVKHRNSAAQLAQRPDAVDVALYVAQVGQNIGTGTPVAAALCLASYHAARVKGSRDKRPEPPPGALVPPPATLAILGDTPGGVLSLVA